MELAIPLNYTAGFVERESLLRPRDDFVKTGLHGIYLPQRFVTVQRLKEAATNAFHATYWNSIGRLLRQMDTFDLENSGYGLASRYANKQSPKPRPRTPAADAKKDSNEQPLDYSRMSGKDIARALGKKWREEDKRHKKTQNLKPR